MDILGDMSNHLLENNEKPPTSIQRSVAFDLTDDVTEIPIKKYINIIGSENMTQVTISDCEHDNIVKANSTCDLMTGQSDNTCENKLKMKGGVTLRKDVIGILKPPNSRKQQKSFPSLPESMLQDLGLVEHITLK